MEETVDAMNHVLCTRIYDFFAKRSNNKIPPDEHRHQHPSKARQHHQHPAKERRHQRMLKAVKEEKKQTKKQVRALRRDGNNSKAVRTLASTFHHLVKRYSKLVQEEKRAQRRIPFESGMEAAALRKKEKCSDLLARCAASNRDSKLVTLEVGSRGFLNTSSFDHLYRCLRSSKQQERRVMEKDIIKKCIVHSHDIWCRRNWSD